MSQPAASPEPTPVRRFDVPVHPLAAAALVFVDNLWMLADWNALTWFLTIPLSFLSVAFTTLFIQRFIHRDSWGKALAKGFLLGVLAGVPTSITGTPVGLALLTWAGILRAKRATGAGPLVSEARQSSIPIEAQVIASSPPVPPPPPMATPPPPPTAPPPPPRRIEPWWVKLVIVLLLCGTLLLGTKMVLDGVGGIASKFRQGHITETFTSALPKVDRTPGGNLELATSRATETRTRADERNIGWLYIGERVSEISMEVTYRFHLNLRDPWKLEVVGNTCIVRAPAIRPTLPPAIHTETMRKRSEAGWARFDAKEHLAELERSLTPYLTRHAGDPRRIALVREDCRKTTAEFVRDWLLREDHWRRDRFSSIKVIFADESAEPATVLPTLRLLGSPTLP